MLSLILLNFRLPRCRGLHGYNLVVVRFTSTYRIRPYHLESCEFYPYNLRQYNYFLRVLFDNGVIRPYHIPHTCTVRNQDSNANEKKTVFLLTFWKKIRYVNRQNIKKNCCLGYTGQGCILKVHQK